MNCGVYLTFDGNCEEVMTFYQDILDGKFQVMMRYKDGPPEYSKPEIEDKIMHLTMTFGNGGELSASDSFHMPLNKGNNFHVRLLAVDEKQGQAIFDGLSEKAQITMPYNEVFWGGKFGSLIDKYGVQWMISGSDET